MAAREGGKKIRINQSIGVKVEKLFLFFLVIIVTVRFIVVVIFVGNYRKSIEEDAVFIIGAHCFAGERAGQKFFLIGVDILSRTLFSAERYHIENQVGTSFIPINLFVS